MTEDTGQLIAEMLEPECPTSRRSIGSPWLSPGRMYQQRWDDKTKAYGWFPRPFSTDPYAAFDALMRFAEVNPDHEVYYYFRSGEHIVYLYDEDGQFRGAKGNFAAAANDALVQWVRSRE